MARQNPFVILLSILLIPVFATAGDELANPGERPYEAISSNAGVTLSFGTLSVDWVAADGGGEIPALPGAGEFGVAGAPRLPVYSELIAVPDGMDLAVANVQADWEELGVHDFAHDPGQEDDAEPDVGKYERAFARSSETVIIGETGRWRDLRIAPVAIQPIRVDPATGITRLAQNLQVQFTFVPGDGDEYDPPGVSEALLPIYEEYVINAADFIDYDEVVRGTYLIIYPSAWVNEAEDLAAWRTRTGFHVQLATTDETGTSFSSIYDYIESVYETADPPLEYVVLLGDMDSPANIATEYIDPGVPWPIDPAIATDHKYTYDLSGGDTFENVLPRYLIGRISVDNTGQLRTVINKIFQYEQEPLEGNPERWTRGVTIADESYAISCGLTQDWVKYKMLDDGFTNVEQVVRESIWDDPGTQAIADAINDNVSWVTYRGFGSHTSWAGPYFYNSDVDSRIFNTDNAPVITSMVCGGGAFDETDDDPCFGEKWIRHGSPTDLKGAVAFIAPSEIDTHTRWNNMLLGAWYVGLFDQGLRTLGQNLLSAEIQLYNNYPLMWNPYGSNENSVWFYFHSYNILGDPALQLRAEAPRTIEVDHPAVLKANDTHAEVMVFDQYGMPVSNAMVVITRDDDEILGMQRTNHGGVADVPLAGGPEEGALAITVTRPDIVPYQSELNGAGNGIVSLLGVQGVEIDSDLNTNGDGLLNPGELINPRSFMRVEADGGLEQVLVSINVPLEYGDATVPYQFHGSQGEGETFQSTNLRFRLRENLTNGTRVPVTYQVYSNGGTLTHLAQLPPVAAPVLKEASQVFFSDWGPGDTARLNLHLANDNQDVGAGTVSGSIVVDDLFVTVLDGEGAWPAVGPGAGDVPMNNYFRLSVDEDAYPGHVAEAKVLLTTQRGFIQVVELELEVEGAGPNAPTGPAGPGYFVFEDNDAGYEFQPNFIYESIHDAGGTDIGLDDEGNNEDDVVTVDLPFTFTFWDKEYTQLSICSNGWMSFGHSDFFFFRNRPIPGALTPFAAILPLWDDLILDNTNSGVYTYYNEENDWFVIEYYRVWHYDDLNWWGEPEGPPMNFQVLLLDPAVHEAPGGLGLIAILYDDIHNQDVTENYLTAGIISPNGKQALQYEFANENPATAAGVEDGRQLLIAAAGADWYSDPNVEFRPPVVQMNATGGGTGGAEVEISNTGGRATTIEIWPEGIDYGWGVPGGENDEAGGPDNVGYRWYDSRESFGPEYQWVNVAQPANIVPLNEGNPQGYASVSGEIELPWAFPFYGEEYGILWICESGYVTFADPGEHGMEVNTSLPRPYAPHAAIFPYWDNVGTDEGGQVYARATENAFVVTWSNVRQLEWDSEDGPYTFQLVLTPDGAIHTQYNQMQPATNSATIGVQNMAGDDGLLTAYNTAVPGFLADELTVRFAPGLPWLSVTPWTYNLGPGESVNVSLTGDASELAPGLHEGRLLLLSNLDDKAYTLPVDFLVASDDIGYAPVIGDVPGESLGDGESFAPISLDPYVEDWDNPDSEIAWTIYGSDSLQVDVSDDRVVTITPHPDWVGSATLSFRASDPFLNYETVSATFDRGGQNDGPRFDSAIPDALGEIALGESVLFSVTASDPEEDEVELEWYHNGGFIGDGESVTVEFETEGDQTVRVLATDGEGEMGELVWTGNAFDAGLAERDNRVLPDRFAVESVYPNPFNAAVVLRYSLPTTSDVRLVVYNLLGREVARRAVHAAPAGRHEIALDATRWASGLYFLEWKAGDAREVRKAVLLK